jgi:hypothetical protein
MKNTRAKRLYIKRMTESLHKTPLEAKHLVKALEQITGNKMIQAPELNN